VNRALDDEGDTVEVEVAGLAPIVERGLIEDAVAHGGRWIVVTDRPGHRPLGKVPDGGVLVTTVEVRDAVKDTARDRVTGALERSELVEVIVPVILERALVGEILAAWPDDPVDVVGRVADMGGTVREASLPA
jgi:hypothetical protein